MSFFTLFLPDFRSFVKNIAFNSEYNPHPVFYFEDDSLIYFYKPVGEIIYKVILFKEALPENLTVSSLKLEFEAIELPSRPDQPTIISGTIS